jgi:hypothetical protein
MKQTETIQIFLNSKTANKYYNGFTSHCQFNLPHIIIPRSKSVYVSVQSASIPYSFYNVDGFNDTLIYSVNGGSNVIIQIPQGNYNTTTLRTYLLSMMTGFTITYSSLDNTFTFTHSNYDFIFKSISTCMEILGFQENISHSSSSKILKSKTCINLFTIRNIYIQSDNLLLSNINNATPNNSNILCSIPLTSGQFSVITYSNINNVKSQISDIKNFTSLNISLTDQDGDILDLNGCHFSLTLQIDIEF